MIQKEPLISVIVAVYNGAVTLQQCIDSIASQTYCNKELIIIDGASTDDTINILRANSNKLAYWESKPDRGIYHAWNKALEHTNGDWVCFLGADDFFWEADVIEKMVDRLIETPINVRLVYGQMASITPRGKLLQILGEPWQRTKSLLTHQMPPHPGLMHRRSIFEVHGKFDESFRIAADYELLLRELKTADILFIPDLIVAGMTHGGISCNLNHIIQLLREDIRARRKNNITAISIQLIRYYLRMILSTISWRVLGEDGVKHLSVFRRPLFNRSSSLKTNSHVKPAMKHMSKK